MNPSLRPARLTLLAFLLAFPSAALAADGDLDTTFDGGTVRIGWNAVHAVASVVEALPDGDLLVGGTVAGTPGEVDAWMLAELDGHGHHELGWLANYDPIDLGEETMMLTGELLEVALDAQGRILLAGYGEDGIHDAWPALARLLPSGARDTAYDGNGVRLITDFPAGWTDVRVRAAAFHADGRSVFVGSCSSCPTEDERWIWATRRLADGSPDTSFSGDGWMSFHDSSDTAAFASAVNFGADGRVTIGGGATLAIFSTPLLARLGSGGALDSGFGGGDGIADVGGLGGVRDLAVDPVSGRIAVAISESTTFPSGGEVRVFTAAGEHDTTFSGDGTVDLDLEEGASISAVAFQSDRKLLAVGSIDANGEPAGGFFLARMTVTGALDSTFDDNGVKRVELEGDPAVVDWAYAVTTSSGRLVAAGVAGAPSGGESYMGVVRTDSALIFSDGFERGSSGAWAGY